MFLSVLTKKQKSILEFLKTCSLIKQFYLAGGTGLALLIGHRRSIDFDFFSAQEIKMSKLIQTLKEARKLSVLQEDQDTLTINLSGVKTSFFVYPYPLLKPLKIVQRGIRLADMIDIAAMKIAALAGRGSRKDFIDLYFICQIIPLTRLLKYFQKKYRRVSYSDYHLLKSLVFFEDAEKEPMLRMIKKVSWSTVRSFFQQTIKELI